MQQNVGGARRAHAEKRADDSRGRHRGLEHIGLEPLIEKINGGHGHQLDLVVFVVARHALKAAADEEQLHQFARIERGRVGRDHAEDRLHEAAHGLHRFAEFVVGFGVDPGVAGDFAMRLAVVVHAPQVIAAGHGRERAVEGKNLQAVAGKIEVANNFRPQQRHHVGADRELESGHNFFGAGGAAEHVAAFEHQNFLAGLCQVGGVDQAVVASADDDHVVFRSVIASHMGSTLRRNRTDCSRCELPHRWNQFRKGNVMTAECVRQSLSGLVSSVRPRCNAGEIQSASGGSGSAGRGAGYLYCLRGYRG